LLQCKEQLTFSLLLDNWNCRNISVQIIKTLFWNKSTFLLTNVVFWKAFYVPAHWTSKFDTPKSSRLFTSLLTKNMWVTHYSFPHISNNEWLSSRIKLWHGNKESTRHLEFPFTKLHFLSLKHWFPFSLLRILWFFYNLAQTKVWLEMKLVFLGDMSSSLWDENFVHFPRWFHFYINNDELFHKALLQFTICHGLVPSSDQSFLHKRTTQN